MKKIVYLMEYPIDLPGGVQMSTLSVCEGLAGSPGYGYTPVVICPALLDHKPSDYPFVIREYPMGENRLKNLFIRIRAFREIIEEEAPDLIHIEMSESLITYGFIRKRFRDIPYIYTDRGLLFGYRKRSRVFMDPVLKDADMLVTTTEYNKRLWTEGSDIRPVCTIPNTISDAYFGEYEPDKRKEHEIPVIGLAGRICIEKDWPFACDFIDALCETGLIFKVDIVLSTFEKGDEEQVDIILNRLKKAIGGERVESHLNYTQQQMAEFYYDVDIFLMTSQFESFGKAAVEAMSRKCAVVSTAVGGLPEVIGLPGNLYTKDNISNGIECVKELAGDKEKLDGQREFFYRRYLDNYTEDKYIERHVKLYNEYAGKRK
ncbi:MAG: glycosyltransferase family 4 protein [Lachnospiraceae bacterium]|nr:glycosyltransferase family 4 protein [Lachnospiraceae bacterium]